MKALKITEKVITIKTFESIVKQRAKEFKCNDTDTLALQFMYDTRTINNVGHEVSSNFFAEFGNDGTLSQGKAAKNFVHFVLYGEKLYN